MIKRKLPSSIFLLLWLVLLWTHNAYSEQINEVIHTKVLILGAGAAGISAAKTLHAMGMRDFLILDAQPFIGGRVQHTTFGDHQIELGANWIYGKGTNPIYHLASKHGLKTAPNNKENLAYFDDNGEIPDTQGQAIYHTFEKMMENLVDYADQRMKRHQVDLSSRSALKLLGWHPDTPLKAAVEYFAVDWELAEPAEVSSLDYATGTVDMVTGSFPSGNEFVVDERGFNHILKEEAKWFLQDDDSRLLLNTLVKDIFYGDDNVTVITDNGQILTADYAICTFSLGVLQSDNVNFMPPFPDWKREALLSFHMATYTKIFLKFDRKFWGDWQFAMYANNDTVNGGYYTIWQNLNAPGYLSNLKRQPSNNILMVTTTYKQSERIERMNDDLVQREIMQVLRRMFPEIDLPDPTAILIPRWHSNPLFRGSYSNWPIGVLADHHQNMRAPLAGPHSHDRPRLWFAGEAMSAEYYGFLHGAWIDGDNTAKSIVKCIQGACPAYQMNEYVTGCELRQQHRPRLRYQHL
ncbi:uncharacterized protein BYT42DRAFT_570659 [Radiomyces spectabilis]|uniref:uncharacterized protein n=1 Tax=Radiomyces spectabilis TaxID=64574 RepID=UPI00221F5DCE|nr:uncharacterized protein BYT42DRAFT_570659 [Radiomyces spectabilis]KAI8377544.1 hypothetical protein BYT42DRAFT_570659 [Radiomyces spectabilis]